MVQRLLQDLNPQYFSRHKLISFLHMLTLRFFSPENKLGNVSIAQFWCIHRIWPFTFVNGANVQLSEINNLCIGSVSGTFLGG